MPIPKNKKKYNQALNKLISTKRLTSDLLQPLGIPFEWFLRLADNTEETSTKKINALINHLSKFNQQTNHNTKEEQ
jgi:hypothetical protein